jgi:hypothetical protein
MRRKHDSPTQLITSAHKKMYLRSYVWPFWPKSFDIRRLHFVDMKFLTLQQRRYVAFDFFVFPALVLLREDVYCLSFVLITIIQKAWYFFKFESLAYVKACILLLKTLWFEKCKKVSFKYRFVSALSRVKKGQIGCFDWQFNLWSRKIEASRPSA